MTTPIKPTNKGINKLARQARAGQSLSEYALLGFFVLVGALVGMQALGVSVTELMADNTSRIVMALTGG